MTRVRENGAAHKIISSDDDEREVALFRAVVPVTQGDHVEKVSK
jgi:hypothetical protein